MHILGLHAQISLPYYVSKLLGKSTINMKTHNRTKGRNGSYTTNFQLTGRELLTPDEVRLLDNEYALLFVRGAKPIIDKKYNLLAHPNISMTTEGTEAVYIHNNGLKTTDLTDAIGLTRVEDYLLIDDFYDNKGDNR